MLMPPLVQKIEPGDIIGRCRTVRELGRGGVGTVFLATHQTLQIEVALKILSPALSLENPALAERFIREAQLAARIRHPNVIAVMDAAHDETTGLYYIVMEYIGGGSLSWHLRNGPLPEAKALAIVTGIANALLIAEESRIVHRDIKPDNIMLDLRGMAKLADLGLAKHALDSQLSLTIGGSFMGTPAYMSPDQARDAKIADTRDDIYSLGASFYECLTGEPPFQGETPYNIMSELLTKPSPRPSALRPNISRSADLICRKMMAKTRDLRYSNARALLQDLQHAQTYGDSRLEELDAASFDQESLLAHQQERSYGIETSSEGVYAESETPDEPFTTSTFRPASKLTRPRQTNNDVFGAAALLIALVLVTTLLFAWAAPNHPLSFLTKEWGVLMGQPVAAPIVKASPPIKPAKEKEHAHASLEKSSPPHDAEQVAHATPEKATTPAVEPSVSDNNPPTTDIAPVASPVALPVVPDDGTNVATAVTVPPAIPNLPPAQAALPDSAFIARDIAEKTLDPSIVAPTGHAELLKVIGRRDDHATTPTRWTFYFYDKAADGNARIVTVDDGKVVKAGEDLIHVAAPFTDWSILPEEKIQKDSSDILSIVQGQIPNATIAASEFILVQEKNSVPMWRVTIWTRTASGEEHKAGDVTLLAENGGIIKNQLKQP
jgi:serine/threonine protein kinase